MPIRLNLMPFLQEWAGNKLQLRLLAIPRGNPLTALLPGQPAFADVKFVFDVKITPSLSALPSTTSATTMVTLTAPARPQARTLFEALAAEFQIDPAPPAATPRRPATQIKKYAPATYREAAQFTGSRTPFVVSDDSYYCIVNKRRDYKHLPPHNPKVAWGRVIAVALRQPLLAEALGLIVPLTVPISPADLLASGGWIHVTPNAASGISFAAEPDALKIYAARCPFLAAARSLFTPVLFPVADVPPPVSYDELFQEAVSYDDGFAKIVHGAQPRQFEPLKEDPDGSRPHHEAGIRLGWDDEQITIWLNRQIDPAAAVMDAPMGASSYRVDARLAGDTAWHSLCRAQSIVKVGAVPVGNFDGEYGVQTHPLQLEAESTGDFWLPSYYVSWTGPSLAARDKTAHDLIGIAPSAPDTVTGVPPDIALRYGKTYEFRVRMADQTGGGPALADNAAIPGPAPTASVHFRRWVRPKKLKLDSFAGDTPASLAVRRPRLGYPEYGFTGVSADPDAALRADIPAANAEKREVSLPDPDVAAVQITVQVQTLAFDPIGGEESFETVYTTTRPFPAGDLAAPLTLNLNYVDVHSISTLTAPDTGPITVPTARQVRLLIQALGREDAHNDYFGADDVRFGPTTSVAIRKESSDERGLWVAALPGDALKALYLQPDLPADANVAVSQRTIGAGLQTPTDVPTRLAAELRLVADGLTLRAHAGRRVLFGASPALRHVLGPDHSSITFSSKNDLIGHWIVVLQAGIARDWTWDGLGPDGIVVERDGAPVGSVEPTRSAGADALIDPHREQTDLIYFDVVDAKVGADGFPVELDLTYRLTPIPANTTATLDPGQDEEIRLPITTPPAQRPKLVSAGIALSPYQRNVDYSQTQPRERALWLEFDRPPENSRDRYFVRLLRYAPDPLLIGLPFDLPGGAEPPLPIDPELIRAIVGGQSDDRAGLDAMVQLTPSASPVHFLLPLPPGIHDDSPELFGFFTYELRVGHAERWSTAQGRYGTPLRVTGVQHPAPGLNCTIGRDSKGITASAPYANPVLDDRSLQPSPPATDLWFLLYAQVTQADGADHRNVLLSRLRGQPQRPSDKRFQRGATFGAASWAEKDVLAELALLGLSGESPLSCLAVEMLPNGAPVADGLGSQLGEQRILRSSPLSPVLAMCECC
jgi:hypothetical protein